jgi:hypothetical protein
MARGFTRYLTRFTVQASAAITADADSAGTQTAFDTAVSGNADGCDSALIEIDVTAAPATAARCKVYIVPEEFDGAGDAAQKYAGSIAIATVADKYSLEIDGLPEAGKIVIHAVDFGFTASAAMKPSYLADA